MNGSERGLFDPNFCEHRCPVCTRARKGNRFARFLQAIEMMTTFGGCPGASRGNTVATWTPPPILGGGVCLPTGQSG